MLIEKRYLELPVNRKAELQTVKFFEKDKLCFDIKAKIDYENPTDFYHEDLRNFFGKDLTVTCEKFLDFVPVLVNEKRSVQSDSLRPEAHFTAERGWINDPNGLFFYRGKYHLFFQHNPVGPDWGNMHWGHAVSEDLVNWEEKDVALFPDEYGTMFSGSAFIDTENVTGLKENDDDVILLFYTAAGNTSELSSGKKFTQCMAYSTDGGETFQKYEHNPLIQNVRGENRDPKVVYVPELKKYCMVLYLEADVYAFFMSDNLIKWEQTQEFVLEGDNECPDLYALVADDSRKYWVFSGAHDRNIIGVFNSDGLFVPLTESKPLYYGDSGAYASQTFTGLPDNRVIRISWNRFTFPDMPFNCSMTTPSEMSLRIYDGKPRLCIYPTKEFLSQSKDGMVLSGDVEIKSDKSCAVSFVSTFSQQANDISFDIECKEDVFLSVFGIDAVLSAGRKCLIVGQREIPAVPDEKGRMKFRIITETNCVELYIGKGESFTLENRLSEAQNRSSNITVKSSCCKVANFTQRYFEHI